MVLDANLRIEEETLKNFQIRLMKLTGQNSTEDNYQTRCHLQSHIDRISERIYQCCTLESWRQCNPVVEEVTIPGTQIKEYRLSINSRIIIRSILKLALRGLAGGKSGDGRIIKNIDYGKIYVAKDLDVFFADANYMKWTSSSMRHTDKVNYIQNIGNIINRFVASTTYPVPKDIKLLIDYLIETTRMDRFNTKVALCHPSLLCHSMLVQLADYIYFHLMHETERHNLRFHPYLPLSPAQQQGPIYSAVTRDFPQLPYADLTNNAEPFMTNAQANRRIAYLHDMNVQMGDPYLGRTVFGFLGVMKHGLKHLLDPEYKIIKRLGPGLPTPPISPEDVDNYLYAIYPEYMSEVTKRIIESQLLEDCWKLHGFP